MLVFLQHFKMFLKNVQSISLVGRGVGARTAKVTASIMSNTVQCKRFSAAYGSACVCVCVCVCVYGKMADAPTVYCLNSNLFK